MDRHERSRSSALMRLALLSVAAAWLSGCDKSPTGGGDAGPDTGTAGALAVGSACGADSECSGPSPDCTDGIYPLLTLTDNPDLQMLGVALPDGYCSNTPSCSSDADCGTGGECFRPLAPVSAEVLASLSGALPGVDITAFGNYGVCLKPCTEQSECTRPGYACATPLGDLISLVEGADLSTYCIAGDNPCAACDPNATCDSSVIPVTCTCNDGYTGDGATCVVETACDPACVNGNCVSGNTCSCDSGFTGPACDVPVVGGCDGNPCQNSGVCTPGTSPAYTCDCAGTGYTGANCDMPVDCGAAPTVANAGAPSVNGGVGGAASTTSGATATYTCNNGYTLTGSQSTCQTTGAWTAAPTCQINTCPTLSNPTNGMVSGANTFGATATFTCNNGFVLNGASTLTCQANSTWNGTAPTCVDNPCLPDPCSGNGTCNTSTGVCTCNPTHTGPSCNMVISTCALSPCAHGTCTDGPRTCNCTGTGYTGTSCETPVSCGAAPTVANAGAATVSGGVGGGASTTYMATAAYTCNSGYAKTGGNPTCGVTGSWGTAPTCTLIMCPAAPTVTNAMTPTVSGGLGGGSTTTFNATAAYTCNTGFTKAGSNPTCGGAANPGTWGAAPTCTAISCGTAPVVANAAAPTVSGGVGGGSTPTYNATAAYTCNGGFTKNGANPTCQVGGTWSAAPTCTPTAPTTCTLVYDFPAASGTSSAFRIQPSLGATTVNIGGGRITVRVPVNGATGAPQAGTAELLYYDMDQFFGPVSGVTTETRICLLESGAATPTIAPSSAPPEQAAVPACIDANNTTTMATGSFALNAGGTGGFTFPCYGTAPTSANYTPAQANGTAAGCMQTWFSYGRIMCASGELCAFAVSPQNTWLDRSGRWSQHLSAITLSSNLTTLVMGNRNGGSTTSAWTHVPNNDNGWTGFSLAGTLNAGASTCNLTNLP